MFNQVMSETREPTSRRRELQHQKVNEIETVRGKERLPGKCSHVSKSPKKEFPDKYKTTKMRLHQE